jgi:hypothetical protein
VSLQTRLQDLATAVATDIKQLKVWVTGSSSGSLAGLTTVAKTDLVSAINEINAKPAGAGDVTQADLDAATAQVKADILGAGVPAALDTLDELAQALGDDANFGATVTAALANRVRVDIDTQGLDPIQQANARTNIGTVAASDIGDPTIDLVAVYTAAKA